ncbi:MAG TPA: HAMP domain-containing histidine kinase [Leptolyngbyaceae cyanobacterium M33_DOE_097]|uniref:histidine kinase n=1 Tax=Oscillatoriales cyanobacterium SpSt-418 TaxID=2282169 RepID=A0A7C3PDS7_9CYAN|nr:HAMP domain-containing histidine kinase [Leptolyngbyaceae cyanobacterium M33_DOE_097]
MLYRLNRIYPPTNWHRFLLSARTRILAGLVLLVFLSILISIVLIREILFAQLQGRLQRSLQQEVKEMQKLIKGRDPSTGRYFGNDARAIFRVFFSRNIPSEDEYFVALLNGELYKTSSGNTPETLQPDLQWLARQAQTQESVPDTVTILGERFVYLTYPLPTIGPDRGVFIVMVSLSKQRQQIDRATLVAVNVAVFVTLIALFLAWLVIGRVLSPLQTLTETARSIRGLDQNLIQAIPVRGTNEMVELTITFNEMLHRLQTSFATQREFINDASHELQTPITVIRGHLEILRHTHQRHAEILELVTDELDQMSRLVNDLLLLAKAERPDFLNLEMVEVSQLTEDLFTKSIVLAPRQWMLASTAQVRIVADYQRLTQLMMNLIQNAVEYTAETDEIEVGSQLIDEQVCFWVRDTGIGISPDDQARIWRRFARGSNSHRTSKGAGIGLSLVKAIAEAHGGSVSVWSQPGVGSRFTVMLPIDPL